MLIFIEMYFIFFYLELSIYWVLFYYYFDEDVGDVELEIIRVGFDFFYILVVWCVIRLLELFFVNLGEDYILSFI